MIKKNYTIGCFFSLVELTTLSCLGKTITYKTTLEEYLKKKLVIQAVPNYFQLEFNLLRIAFRS